MIRKTPNGKTTARPCKPTTVKLPLRTGKTRLSKSHVIIEAGEHHVDEEINKAENNISKKNGLPPVYKRDIHLIYKEEQIGEKMLERIRLYYTKGAQMKQILNMISTSSESINITTPKPGMRLSIADLYIIIYVSIKNKKLIQRKKFLDFELTCSQFIRVLSLWRKGMSDSHILDDGDLKKAPAAAIKRTIQNIRKRYYSMKKKFNDPPDEGHWSPEILKSLIRDIMCATKSIIDGRPCYIIYTDAISQETFDLIEQVTSNDSYNYFPVEGCKDSGKVDLSPNGGNDPDISNPSIIIDMNKEIAINQSRRKLFSNLEKKTNAEEQECKFASDTVEEIISHGPLDLTQEEINSIRESIECEDDYDDPLQKAISEIMEPLTEKQKNDALDELFG